MSVAADPHVEDFGELDDAGDPEDEGEEKEQGESHADVSEGAGAAVDFAIGRETVDGGGELLAWDVFCQLGGFFVGEREE